MGLSVLTEPEIIVALAADENPKRSPSEIWSSVNLVVLLTWKRWVSDLGSYVATYQLRIREQTRITHSFCFFLTRGLDDDGSLFLQHYPTKGKSKNERNKT